ncbi:MAG: hypothetical protein AB7T31_10210 [Gemmatimonadales bacterium]
MRTLLRALLMLALPVSTNAQRSVDLVSIRPEVIGGGGCALRPPLSGPFWDSVLPPWGADEREFLRDLEGLRDSLRVEAATDPPDVRRLYELAVVLGTLTELQGASAKVKTAQELDALVKRILEIEPGHAGAHHIIGRLHAAIMRLSRIERFVATRLLGGSALSGASWETARHHLEVAATRDPCSPQHRYELAKLYAERGDPARAAEELSEILRMPRTGRFEAHVADLAEALLASLPSS